MHLCFLIVHESLHLLEINGNVTNGNFQEESPKLYVEDKKERK